MALNSNCKEVNAGEILKTLKELVDKIVTLKENDSFSRVQVLKEVESLLKSVAECNNDSEWNDVDDKTIKTLFDCLNDKSEKCRELAVKNLCHFVDCMSKTELFVPFIPVSLLRRLGNSDEREPSEEVRLLEVQLLYKIIYKYEGDLLKYMNDFAGILCMCLIDDYPEIKRKSCECTILLAQVEKDNFHLISSAVLKYLLHTLSHQHFRTRAVCVKTIGYVVCCGKSQDFEDAVTHIAQRLFDHSPIVRSAVTEVVGYWLANLTDRYSFFNRLIPLMLSSLHDEVLDVRSKGKDLWNKTGEQYLMENEKDYKDLMDFPRPDPENYPTKETRPTLGCRILVQRNMFSILPPLIRELTDWVVDIRLKSAQVLYSLILHAEDKATMQLSSFIDGTVAAAKDEAKEVKKVAISCAEMLGFFIDPNLLCDSIMTLIHKSPSAVHLSIFAAVLRGNKKGLSSVCFQAICKFLSVPSACRTRKDDEQANLLLCVEGLFSFHIKIDQSSSYQLFTILSTVSGLTTNKLIYEKALSLLEDLAKEQSCSLESLFKMHSLALVNSIISNNELWTCENAELPIFYFIVKSDCLDKNVLKTALPVMTNNLNMNKDVKLRGEVFTLLIEVFKKLPSIEDNELSEKTVALIKLGVFPNLSWFPGNAACSLRTLAVASFYEIVQKGCFNEFLLKSVSNEVLPILSALAEDDSVANRLLSCKILEILLPKLYNSVEEHKLHSLCHDFLQCLDDGSDDIRISATKILKSYFHAFPKDYHWKSYQSYLKEIYETLVIHMDDKNERIRENVLNLLKDIAFADSQLLLDEIEKKRYMMATGDFCDNLIEHVRKLHM